MNSQQILALYLLCMSSLAASSAPNIIFILADDLGWDDVGFHGSEIKTPNIDRLAGEGVTLNNYYVQPICTPTRGAVLTGKYPIHTGLQHYVIVGSQPYGLPLNVTTLPQELKKLGYKTHAVGKWHLGFCSDAYLPESRGFDSFLGFYLGHADYQDHYSHDGTFMGYDFHYQQKPLWNQSESYSTEIFTAHAKSIIQSHDKSSPLFMYMAHQAVHAGNFDVLQSPQKYVDRFGYITNLKRKLFAGMVSALDDSVGEIHQALVEAGMADNTIIVFSTDNGGPTHGYDGNAACNWPLRGCKNTLWQGGVRGVGFVHSPLLKTKGYVNENLMHATDWLPTLLSAASTRTYSTKDHKKTAARTDSQKALADIDGFNQWDVISSNTSTERKEVLLNIDPIEDRAAIIIGDFKLIRGNMLGGAYSGWYPPPAHKEEISEMSSSTKGGDEGCHGLPCHGHKRKPLVQDFVEVRELLERGNANPEDMLSLMNKQYERLKQDVRSLEFQTKAVESEPSPLLFLAENDPHAFELSKRRFQSHDSSQRSNGNIVKCGVKPINASTNCQPKKKACLYNIREDPCEYFNLANALPSVVKMLSMRLTAFQDGMVPPLNKPIDPKGNPQLHGGVWQPWL